MGKIHKNIVAQYKFENISNLGVDSSGNGNNGTNYGVSSTDGVFGRAASFDGVNDRIMLPTDFSLRPSVDEITFNWWMNKDTTTTVYVWAKTLSNLSLTSQYRCAITSTNILFQIGGVGDTQTTSYSSAPIIGHGWVMCTLTLPALSAGMKFYINEVEQTRTGGSGIIGNYTNNYPMTLGCRHDGSLTNFALYFDGLMDDFRAYNKVLPITDIKRVMHGLQPISI